jgi:hypothetical protein
MIVAVSWVDATFSGQFGGGINGFVARVHRWVLNEPVKHDRWTRCRVDRC